MRGPPHGLVSVDILQKNAGIVTNTSVPLSYTVGQVCRLSLTLGGGQGNRRHLTSEGLKSSRAQKPIQQKDNLSRFELEVKPPGNLPRLGGLTIEETSDRQDSARKASDERLKETRDGSKGDGA